MLPVVDAEQNGRGVLPLCQPIARGRSPAGLEDIDAAAKVAESSEHVLLIGSIAAIIASADDSCYFMLVDADAKYAETLLDRGRGATCGRYLILHWWDYGKSKGNTQG